VRNGDDMETVRLRVVVTEEVVYHKVMCWWKWRWPVEEQKHEEERTGCRFCGGARTTTNPPWRPTYSQPTVEQWREAECRSLVVGVEWMDATAIDERVPRPGAMDSRCSSGLQGWNQQPAAATGMANTAPSTRLSCAPTPGLAEEKKNAP
jgi:hypothetical protein